MKSWLKSSSVAAQVKWSYKGLFDALAPPGGKYKAFAQGIAAQMVCFPRYRNVGGRML